MNYRISYLGLLLSFSVLTSYGFKSTSHIYSTSGELLINSNFSIDSARLDDFVMIECFVLPGIYNNIKYPETALWNGIHGIVIAKINIDSTGKIDVEIVKSSNYAFFDESVVAGINASTKSFVVYTKKMKLPFEFYVPFIFHYEKETYNEDLERNNAVTIRGRGLPGSYTIVK